MSLADAWWYFRDLSWTPVPILPRTKRPPAGFFPLKWYLRERPPGRDVRDWFSESRSVRWGRPSRLSFSARVGRGSHGWNRLESLCAAIVKSGETHYRIGKEAVVPIKSLDWFVSGKRPELRSGTIDKLCAYFGLELCPKKPKKRRR